MYRIGVVEIVLTALVNISIAQNEPIVMLNCEKLPINGASYVFNPSMPCPSGADEVQVTLQLDPDLYTISSLQQIIDCDQDFVSFVETGFKGSGCKGIKGFQSFNLPLANFDIGEQSFINMVESLFREHEFDFYFRQNRINVFKADVGKMSERTYIKDSLIHVDLYYDPGFYQNSDEIEINIVLFHELAHIVIGNLHSETGIQQELDADTWSGKKIAKMYGTDGNFELIKNYITTLFSNYDSTNPSYPDKEARIEAFLKGWKQVETFNNSLLADDQKTKLIRYQQILDQPDTPLDSIKFRLDSLLSTVVDFDSLEALIHGRLGEYYFKTKNYNLARNHFQEYTQYFSADLKAQYSEAKAWYYYHNSLTPPIRAKFIEILTNTTDKSLKSEIYHLLAKYDFHNNRIDEAYTNFKESIDLDPSYTNSYIGLVNSMLALGHNKFEVLTYIEKGLEIENSQTRHNRKIDSLVNTKQYIIREIFNSTVEEGTSSKNIQKIFKADSSFLKHLPDFDIKYSKLLIKEGNFHHAYEILMKAKLDSEPEFWVAGWKSNEINQCDLVGYLDSQEKIDRIKNYDLLESIYGLYNNERTFNISFLNFQRKLAESNTDIKNKLCK